jgi:flagellar protein FlgJ
MPDAISDRSLQVQQAIHSFSRINEMKERPKPGQAPVASRESAELKNACAEMESLFIFHLLKEMRSTIPKTGLLTGGRGEELYTSMFDAQIARELASERGIGLSTLLTERLSPSFGPEEKNGDKDQKNAKVPGMGNR